MTSKPHHSPALGMRLVDLVVCTTSWGERREKGQMSERRRFGFGILFLARHFLVLESRSSGRYGEVGIYI